LGRHDEARKELDLAELCAGVGALKDLVTRQRRWCEDPDSEATLHRCAERVFGEAPGEVADELQALINRYPDFWEARMLLGIALRRLERWDDARRQFEAVIEERSVPAAEKELTGIYSKLGDLPKALEFAKRAYEAQPDDPEVVANYAAALLENDELTEAYKYARRAQTMAPTDEITRALIEQILARSESRGFLANIKAAAKYVGKKLRRKKK
jgi:Flp pilus assembly protein TadD